MSFEVINTSDVLISNVTADTTIISWLPSLPIMPGRMVRITAKGAMTTSASPSQKIFRVKIGALTLGTLQFAPSNGLVLRDFNLEATLTFRTMGPVGTVTCHIEVRGVVAAAAVNLNASMVAPATVDTGAVITLTGAHSAATAGNSIIIRQAFVQLEP